MPAVVSGEARYKEMKRRSYKPGDLRAVNAVVDRFRTVPVRLPSRAPDASGCNLRLELQGEGDADDTHASHQLAAHLRQRTEHMFDTSTRCGETAVAPLPCIGDALGAAAFALDMHTPAVLFQFRFLLCGGVAAISVDIAVGVGAVQQRLKYCGVSDCGMRGGYFAYQLVAFVHADVQLVAEVSLAVFPRPARVDILLRTFVQLLAQRHRAFLDDVGLRALVALDRGGPAPPTRRRSGRSALCSRVAVIAVGRARIYGCPRRPGPGGPKQPDRLSVANAAAFGQVKKLQEAAAVEQLIFQRVVRHFVELLEYQHLYHQHRGIRRTATLGERWPRSRHLDAGGQGLEVNVFDHADQRIADLRTPVFGFMLGKHADPELHHCGTRSWVQSQNFT